MSKETTSTTNLNGKTIFVTGGAGSIGKLVVSQLVKTDVHAVRVFDSDEYGLFQLKHSVKSPKLRLLIGDIKDRDRIRMALKGIDYVVHAAALKNIEVTEYNTVETIRTNVDGTVNLIENALDLGLEKFLYVSSDKAVNSTTLYGATKFIGEKLMTWADTVSTKGHFSVVRFGNVYEARGNVFDLWDNQRKAGEPITITEPEATRYFWHTTEAAAFIISSLRSMTGGEIFVPKMERRKMKDVAYRVTGLRKDEKLHEELLTADESKRAVELKDRWVIRA